MSLNLVTGNDGIIAKARKAVAETEKAKEEEALELMEAEAIMAKYLEPWDGEVATKFASGSGSKNDPYVIEKPGELAFLVEEVKRGKKYDGKYIELTQSINLGDIEIEPIGKGSTGERNEEEWNMTENCFNGTLNGNGKVISGVNINQPDMHGVGIIGVLGEKGVVKNLNVNEGTIIGKTCVGGIAGASKGSIINCTNKLTVIAQDDETSNSGQMAGGIAGWATKGSIENCKNYGNIITKDDSLLTGRGKYAGGIVGFVNLEEDMTISNCINSGTVLAVYQQAGGIVGSSEYSEDGVLTIKNCTNSGSINGGESGATWTNNLGYSGGIISWAYSETNITNCINSGTITAEKIVGRRNSGTSKCRNNKLL